MTTPTVWPARLAGDRILCGHKVHGKYACDGEIARWVGERAYLGPGYTEDPPGSHRWRLTLRSERVASPSWRRKPLGYVAEHATLGYQAPPRPWTRTCPQCHCIAEVADLSPGHAREARPESRA